MREKTKTQKAKIYPHATDSYGKQRTQRNAGTRKIALPLPPPGNRSPVVEIIYYGSNSPWAIYAGQLIH